MEPKPGDRKVTYASINLPWMAVSWPPWAWHTTAGPRERGRARSARHIGGRPRRRATRGGAAAATGEGDEAGAATETETATARLEAIAADGDGSERVGTWEEARGIGVEGKVVGRESSGAVRWMGGQISINRPRGPAAGDAVLPTWTRDGVSRPSPLEFAQNLTSSCGGPVAFRARGD